MGHPYGSARRATVGVAAAVLAGLGTVTGPAPAAHADDKVKACPGGSICLYQNSQYGGEMKDIRVEGIGSWAFSVGWMNDRTSSIFNNSAVPVAVYQDPQQENNDGACAIVPPRASIPNVGSFWNDRISLVFSATDRCSYGATGRSIP